MATLTLVEGAVELKDQLRDYKYRGEELELMNFLEFMLETYEVTKESEAENETPGDEVPKSRGAGRPPSTRIPYQDIADKGKRCRIIRQPGHETLPRFIGKWFCRSDNDLERDLFRASMLMLLKPWRKLHELKGIMETFESAFETFMLQTSKESQRVVANVQYYYECSDAAKADREKARIINQGDQGGQDDFDRDVVDTSIENEGGYGADPTIMFEEITDEDLERALKMKTNPRERLYGESAVALGYDVGFFNEEDIGVISETKARKMQADEGEQIRTWETQLKEITREQIKNFGMIRMTEEADDPGPSIALIEPAATSPGIQCQANQTVLAHDNEGRVGRNQLAMLNREQRRAHDIIEERLKEHITGEYFKTK